MFIFDPKKNTLTKTAHLYTQNYMDMGVRVDKTVTEWVKKPGYMWSAGGDYIKEFKFTKKQFVIVHEFGRKTFPIDDVMVKVKGGKHSIFVKGSTFVNGK